MAFTRTASGVCVANLHATNDLPAMATEDVLRAARAATELAGDAPLLFGGDLNLRPAEQPAGLRAPGARTSASAAPTAPRAIDHLLARGLEVLEPPTAWPPERRELPLDGRALRLSDHAPVEATIRRQSHRCCGIEIVEPAPARNSTTGGSRDGREKSSR